MMDNLVHYMHTRCGGRNCISTVASLQCYCV